MRIPFAHKGNHHCEAAVVSCVDFRFREPIAKYLTEGLGLKHFDRAAIPGGVKGIVHGATTAHSCFKVPCDLHGAKKIVLINHTDCGAYGGAKNFSDRQTEEAFHRQELLQAKKIVANEYPDREIILVLAKLDEAHENIDFIKVV